MTNFAWGRTFTRLRISLTATPSQVLSSFDHRVTQWMSDLTVVRGSARNSFHVHDTSCSTSPKHRNVHVFGSKRGVRPYVSTGHFVVRTWPGGTRAARSGFVGLAIVRHYNGYALETPARQQPEHPASAGHRSPPGASVPRRPRPPPRCQTTCRPAAPPRAATED